MKKILLFVHVLIILTTITEAQIPNPRRNRPSPPELQLWKLRRMELIVGPGITQIFGDIGGFSKGENLLGLKDLSVKQTGLDLSAGLRYRLSRKFSGRVNLAFGSFHATDERGSNETRGFETTTFFFEPSLTAEYYIIKSRRESSYIFLKGRRVVLLPILSTLDLYAFTGIGAISYNVSFNDIVPVTPVTTHGFAAVIPAGLGATIAFSGQLNLGLEVGGRYAFTDYLDGYTSIYSKSNDIYYFMNITMTYKLKTGQGFRM